MKSNPPWPETAYFLAAFLQAAVDVEPAAAAYRTAFAADAARLARLYSEMRSLVAPARSDNELGAFLAACAPRWRGYNGRQVLLRSARVLFHPPPPADATMSTGVPATAAEAVSQPARQTPKTERAAGQAEQIQQTPEQVVPTTGAAVAAEQRPDPQVAPHPRRQAAISEDLSGESGPPWPETAYFLAAFLQAAADVEPAAAAYRTAFAADAARLARLDSEMRSLVAPARSDNELNAFLAACAPRWRGHNGRQVLHRSARVLFHPPPPADADAPSTGVPATAAEAVSQPMHQPPKTVPAAGQAEQTLQKAEQVQQTLEQVQQEAEQVQQEAEQVVPNHRRGRGCRTGP